MAILRIWWIRKNNLISFYFWMYLMFLPPSLCFFNAAALIAESLGDDLLSEASLTLLAVDISFVYVKRSLSSQIFIKFLKTWFSRSQKFFCTIFVGTTRLLIILGTSGKGWKRSANHWRQTTSWVGDVIGLVALSVEIAQPCILDVIVDTKLGGADSDDYLLLNSILQ